LYNNNPQKYLWLPESKQVLKMKYKCTHAAKTVRDRGGVSMEDIDLKKTSKKMKLNEVGADSNNNNGDDKEEEEEVEGEEEEEVVQNTSEQRKRKFARRTRQRQ
jgi:hypothetical protein